MERPDEGRRRTDEALAALEQRIASVYEQAAKELQPEIDGYFSQFAQRDAQQKALLEAGEITEEGYKQWRLAQIGRGRRLEALRDQVAERVTRANETAVAYVNDATPGIYTLNRNYAAYTIEQAAGEVGFTLWDEQAVKRLSAEQPELMPYYPPERAVRRGIDLAYGKQQVTAGITSSILQGRSVRHMADDLQRRITAMSRDSAIRTARTAVTGAQNAGRMDGYTAAEKMGIRLKKEWLATLDGRTRHSHAALDGERRDNGQPFSNGCMFPGDPSGAPKEVYNCFIGETQVASDGKIVRSYKHKYEGELIKIETASGVHFSCTPNHPILTPRGWVAAAFLNDGDDLLIASIGDGMNAWGNPHINHIFPRMDALHEFFNEFFGKRTCALGVNFHGDIPATDVEIVTHKRFLWDDGNLSGRKSVYELLLKLANKSFMGKGAAMKHLWRICKAALRFVRGICKPLSLLWRSLRHPGIHRFGASADGDTGVIEPAIDNLPTDPVFLCEFLDRLPCKVFTDNIIRINRIVAKCHVYNLQTATGHYFVNTSIPHTNGMYNGSFAIAKNCRCTLIADVEGVDASDVLRRDRDGLLPDMTFAQWEDSKRGAKGASSFPHHWTDEGAGQEGDIADGVRRAAKSLLHSETVVGFDGLPKDVQAAFREGLIHAAPEARTVLRREYRKADYILATGKKSYYRSGTASDIITLGAGASPSTLAHELFHRLDQGHSISKTLTAGLTQDYVGLNVRSNGEIADFLMRQYPFAFATNPLRGNTTLKEAYRGISDIISGLSDGEINLGFRHDTEYWKLKGAVESEAWAQFGRIQYENDSDALKMLADIFPKFSKSAMLALKGLI